MDDDNSNNKTCRKTIWTFLPLKLKQAVQRKNIVESMTVHIQNWE